MYLPSLSVILALALTGPSITLLGKPSPVDKRAEKSSILSEITSLIIVTGTLNICVPETMNDDVSPL